MVTLTQEEKNNLFSSFGPLSSFGARIAIAYAFGFFGERTRHDLRLLKEIRNAFAHVNLKIDFATPEIARLCGEFHCLAEEANSEKLDPQAQLAAATEILLVHLMSKSEWTVEIPPIKSLD